VYRIFVGSCTVEADNTQMHAKETSPLCVTCISHIRTL